MSQRPIVVRDRARQHRARANHNAMREVLPEWLRAPYHERFRLAARLLPVQTLMGNVALLAWMVFLVLVWSGHVTVQ